MRSWILLTVCLAPFSGAALASGPPFQRLLGVTPLADALFDDTVLHEARLAISSRDWQALKDHFLENTYYPADFRWRGVVARNVGIRSRGTGSRSGTKPGLRIDFDRYSIDQRYLGLRSIVLRNNTQDPSTLRERLSMLLFRRLGLPAPREAHARLFVNNEYVGLYTIVETVDRTFLKARFNDDAGYLYEYDYPPEAAPYYFEYRGSDPNQYVPLPFKPETHETDPQAAVIVRMIDTINRAGDASFRSAMAPYLDLRRFIQHVAVEAFLADDDGMLGNYGMNNFYLYRFSGTTLFTFIVWDKSDAFMGGSRASIWHNVTDVPPSLRNRLMSRAMRYPDLYALYLDALIEAVRSATEIDPGSSDGRGWLEREIEREYAQVRESALADPVKPHTNPEFEQEVERLRAFARERASNVMEEVARSRGASALPLGGSAADGRPNAPSYGVHAAAPKSRNDWPSIGMNSQS
jgi:hypothetical protein